MPPRAAPPPRNVQNNAQRDPTAPPRAPFSFSSSFLTMGTLIASFVVLCTFASYASTEFALVSAQPVYALYPSFFAAMVVGGVCACICYSPTMLAVLCFQILFDTDIRKGGTPPPGAQPAQPPHYGELVMSLFHDAANTIKLALVIAPVYAMTLGSSSEAHVGSRALEAAAGGQLAAAIMTMKIMVVGMREIWGLVPLVVFRLDRDAGT